MKADIGLIGLATMGQNLVLNMVDKGYTVAVYNRTEAKTREFSQGRSKVIPAYAIEDFIKALARPRKILLMVQAGAPVDDFIEKLIPFLEDGDIIIDGGNSNYLDTERRYNYLTQKGLRFIGMGISGGEEGARNGTSYTAGGSKEAWDLIKPILDSTAAKAHDGRPCAAWMGSGGAGHFVKMVHNGIEYADMQLISEIYSVLRFYLDFTSEELAGIFADWNRGELQSYLIEITSKILGKKENGSLVLDSILDVAGQKGTGKWAITAALDLGTPVTVIAEAVLARFLSTIKEQRIKGSILYPLKSSPKAEDKGALVDDLRKALYAAKIISYAQGFMLLKTASDNMKWHTNLGTIALVWRAGCIIRSKFLDEIYQAFNANKDLENILFYPSFVDKIRDCEESLRRVVGTCVANKIPCACLSSALAFFDASRTPNLPANLIQAQRDFFGAHTYEKTTEPRGKFFHTEWAN